MLEGLSPVDFFPVIENGALTNLFSELIPSASYLPQLDFALQPMREKLLKDIFSAP